MWYFTWILGVCLAASFAVLNAMWLELEEDDAEGAGENKGPREKDGVRNAPSAD
jgi:cytochrome bd-I ubiquinol oxidase subunit X